MKRPSTSNANTPSITTPSKKLKFSDMKYTITHKCGHTEDIKLYGPYESRERKIKALEGEPCQDCKKAAVNEKVKSMGLQDLNGTEKQVNWANTLRTRTYEALEQLRPRAINKDAKRVLQVLKTYLDSKTNASWWIDNRYDLPTPNGDLANTLYLLNKLHTESR